MEYRDRAIVRSRMNKNEFFEYLHNGENSKVEFKNVNVSADKLAKEIVSFLNHEGGYIFLGVEDDGAISGTLTDKNLEEWVANACRDKIDLPTNPTLFWIREVEPGKDVLVVEVAPGANKPYAFSKNKNEEYYIRVGSTVRKASREEMQRLFQASGQLNYGLKPVDRTDINSLDRRRLIEYFIRSYRSDDLFRIFREEILQLRDVILRHPSQPDQEEVNQVISVYYDSIFREESQWWDDMSEWERLLRNIDIMIENRGQSVATIDGLLLFGKNPKRFLPQSGIRALCYPGIDRDYATRADEYLTGPMVSLKALNGTLVEPGLPEQAWDFVRRNTTPTAYLEGMQRVDRWEYPERVVREAIVNALVHRDYTITGTEITLTIYEDRMEIESPGRLPNTVTVEKMKTGTRYMRNQTLTNIMRDYGYVESQGMGVRNKIIPGMLEHNGTEPDLIEDDDRFIVRLWKEKTNL